MSFFSKLVKPYRKGERNLERGRAAEGRRDFKKAEEYFRIGAEAFDEHIAKKLSDGEEVRPSHLVMAGICYTRIGRYEDALKVLDECIERKIIPDAFLHAGYSAAKLGDADKAIEYWKGYPSWVEQRIIEKTLNAQIKLLRSQDTPDLQGACEAVAEAVLKQDFQNDKDKKFQPYKPVHPPKRRY